MNFRNLEEQELEMVSGGCGWCYVGAGLVVAGSVATGGLLGGAIGAVGVVTVLL